MTLGKKLTVGFGLSIAISIGLAIYMIVTLNSLAALQDTGASRAKDVETALKAAELADSNYSILADAIINRDLAQSQEEWKTAMAKSHELTAELKKLVDTPEEQGLVAAAAKALAEMDSLFTKELLPQLKESAEANVIKAIDDKVDGLKEEVNASFTRIADSFSEEASEADASFDNVRSRSISLALILSIVGIAAALVLALFINRSVGKAVSDIAGALQAAAGQIDSASQEVASGGQALASGASQQAASLEQTAAGLEELASSSKQNAENARAAAIAVTAVERASKDSGKSVEEMRQAIKAIQLAAQETENIVKLIDGIAFQTNLLALNAAVEAARAGDAGKGFAVVAEEVRTLAQRSGSASRDTSEKIQRAIKLADSGVQAVEVVTAGLTDILQASDKAAGLVQEISAATEEQSANVAELNKAICELDKVTQSNAAHSEEFAAAAEQLSAQSGQLQENVSSLSALIHAEN